MKNNPVVKVLKVIVMALLTTLWMFLKMIGRFVMGFFFGRASTHSDDDLPYYKAGGSVTDPVHYSSNDTRRY